MVHYDDNTLMPFGKYKGYKLANVPGSYLLRLYEEGKLSNESLKVYIKYNLQGLRQEKKINIHNMNR